MRIAILSDIHANRTALDAVLADLRETAPDQVFHGGDLADNGSDPAGVLDQIRDLGWPGVMGNTDEMLVLPESLENYAARTPAMQPLLPAIREMAAASRDLLGEDRIAWLRALPILQTHDLFALVHASPESPWRAASDDDFQSLGRPIALYGHIHTPFVRPLDGFTVANSGSVGLPYDGDPRASYLLVDNAAVTIRRVEYDIEKEIRELESRRRPHSAWLARMLRSARPQLP